MLVILSLMKQTSDWPGKDASKSFTFGSFGSTPGSCKSHNTSECRQPNQKLIMGLKKVNSTRLTDERMDDIKD